MSAERELAAWTTSGEKLWTTFVEPPWSFDVAGHDGQFDVMGTRRAFSKHTGPAH